MGTAHPKTAFTASVALAATLGWSGAAAAQVKQSSSQAPSGAATSADRAANRPERPPRLQIEAAARIGWGEDLGPPVGARPSGFGLGGGARVGASLRLDDVVPTYRVYLGGSVMYYSGVAGGIPPEGTAFYSSLLYGLEPGLEIEVDHFEFRPQLEVGELLLFERFDDVPAFNGTHAVIYLAPGVMAQAKLGHLRFGIDVAVLWTSAPDDRNRRNLLALPLEAHVGVTF